LVFGVDIYLGDSINMFIGCHWSKFLFELNCTQLVILDEMMLNMFMTLPVPIDI